MVLQQFPTTAEGFLSECTKKGVSAERVVFTTLHAGGKFDNNAYKTSGGLHGVGSSVVNALSTQLTVTVKSGGQIHQDKYEYGNPVVELVDGLLPVIGRTKETGTTINFTPDPTIFDKTRFKAEDVKSRLHETAYISIQSSQLFFLTCAETWRRPSHMLNQRALSVTSRI